MTYVMITYYVNMTDVEKFSCDSAKSPRMCKVDQMKYIDETEGKKHEKDHFSSLNDRSVKYSINSDVVVIMVVIYSSGQKNNQINRAEMS